METELIGISSNIQEIKKQIIRIAKSGLNTVVWGETGVGKELVVKLLYEKSLRFGKPFVKVNCAPIPDTLLESEMFGYKQGAFTGAVRGMRGKFEQAHGGVLFLDEIGDMSFQLQAKLLHALQDAKFTPLGSENSVRSNIWNISATNRDLKQDILEKKFRADLYYRISETTIHIEPLRNRPQDIPHLIKYYEKKYASACYEKQPKIINKETVDKLCNYFWPGNVRELQNVLRRLIVLNEDDGLIDFMINTTDSKSISNNHRRSGQSSSLRQFLGLNGKESDLSSLSLKKIKKKTTEVLGKQHNNICP